MHERGIGLTSSRDAPAERILFLAHLRPHRALSRRGRHATLATFAVLQGGVGLAFGLAGAWPAAFFLGLTWLGLALAFARNARDAFAYEELALSPLELRYARVSPQGARRDWRFNPLWVQLRIERHAEFGVERLDLFARHQRIEIARCLGRDEKTLLAQDLSAALALARRGPRFS
jgi:uncharacterized membrane protein